MRLDRAFKSVATAFTFLAGIAAVLTVLHIALDLLFWNHKTFATIFCMGWALQSYLAYHWDDPEWLDRARILVRLEDEEGEEDG